MATEPKPIIEEPDSDSESEGGEEPDYSAWERRLRLQQEREDYVNTYEHKIRDQACMSEVDAVLQALEEKEHKAKIQDCGKKMVEFSSDIVTCVSRLFNLDLGPSRKTPTDRLADMLEKERIKEEKHPELKAAREHLFCQDNCYCSYLNSMFMGGPNGEPAQCKECQEQEEKLLSGKTEEEKRKQRRQWYIIQKHQQNQRYIEEQTETEKEMHFRMGTAYTKIDPAAKVIMAIARPIVQKYAHPEIEKEASEERS